MISIKGMFRLLGREERLRLGSEGRESPVRSPWLSSNSLLLGLRPGGQMQQWQGWAREGGCFRSNYLDGAETQKLTAMLTCRQRDFQMEDTSVVQRPWGRPNLATRGLKLVGT